MLSQSGLKGNYRPPDTACVKNLKTIPSVTHNPVLPAPTDRGQAAIPGPSKPFVRAESPHHGCCRSRRCVRCPAGETRPEGTCGTPKKPPGPGRVPPGPPPPSPSPQPRRPPPRGQRAPGRILQAPLRRATGVTPRPAANPPRAARGRILRQTAALFLLYVSLSYATCVRRALT